MLKTMLLFEHLGEERINAAVQRGELTDLPGAGKPLPAEDLSMVPEELRMAYKILKNAGFVPPEVALRRQIGHLESLIRDESDAKEQRRQARKLLCLFQQLDNSRERTLHLSLQEDYYRKILQRLSGT